MIYIAGMRRREVPTLVTALTLFLLAGCGSSGTPRSNEAVLAARGRASLVATFTDTPWRLPPSGSAACVKARQSSTARASSDDYEDSIYCSLDRSAMRHLLGRLDQGLGPEVTAEQRSCINRRVTRDQIAALLNAERGTGTNHRVATVSEFDDQLASGIRQCTAG